MKKKLQIVSINVNFATKLLQCCWVRSQQQTLFLELSSGSARFVSRKTNECERQQQQAYRYKSPWSLCWIMVEWEGDGFCKRCCCSKVLLLFSHWVNYQAYVSYPGIFLLLVSILLQNCLFSSNDYDDVVCISLLYAGKVFVLRPQVSELEVSKAVDC